MKKETLQQEFERITDTSVKRGISLSFEEYVSWLEKQVLQYRGKEHMAKSSISSTHIATCTGKPNECA
jgi:hypothetical protein